MTQDYYALDFMDRSVDTRPIAPALEAFFDDVLSSSVSQLNFKSLVDGLGDVLFAYPFRVPPYYALILRSLTVLEGLALQADPNYRLLARAYPYMAKRLLADPAPQLRATFEEMVVEEVPAGGGGATAGRGGGAGGAGAAAATTRLRWGRLEGLLRAGAQSYDFDPSQLWLLAEWMLGGPEEAAVGAGGGGGGGSSGGGGGGASAELRASVAEEAARLLDSVAAAQARSSFEAALGREAALAAVPEQPGERVARERVELILATVSGGGGGGGGGSGAGDGQEGIRGSPASTTTTATLTVPPGSGPFGMVVSPADAARVVQEAIGALVAAAAAPAGGGGDGGGGGGPEWAMRATALARRPEAREMASMIGRRLAQRAAARAVKLGFGMVDLATRPRR
jgi:aarF domain-containing kinase